MFTLIPPIYLSPENLVCFFFMSVAYTQVHLYFIIKVNIMYPWEQSDLGPKCLQNRLPKNKSRRESR